MDKNSLTPDGVCAIIKQCAASGVTELAFGDLVVRFGGWKQADDFHADVEVPEGMLAKQDAIASEELEREELSDKDDFLAHSLVEDPVAFEELASSGDLTSSTVGDERDGENDTGSESPLP